MRALGRRTAGLTIVAGCVLAGCKKPAPGFVPPPPPEVSVANPVVRDVPLTLEYPGVVRGVESVEIRARVRGFLMERHVENGRRVEPGDLLFTIDPRTFEATVRQVEAEVKSAESQARLAVLTLERLTQARTANAASPLEVDRATAEREAAEAQVQLASAKLRAAQLDLEFTQVRAPIRGRIGFVAVDEGQLVGANEPTLLGTIINDEKVYATYEMPEPVVLSLRETFKNRRPGEDGRPNLKVRLAMANDTAFVHEGEFFSADNTVDVRTGTVRIEAIFENKDGRILPGSFVRVQPQFPPRSAMLVPQMAVLQDQGGRYVYIVNGGDKAERVAVRPAGSAVDRMLPIEEVNPPATGARLTPQSRVVVNGLQRVRPELVVKPTGLAGVGGETGAAISAPPSGSAQPKDAGPATPAGPERPAPASPGSK